jgi:3-oxoacyl-[acyl-carrier protein] reductase
LGHQVIVCSRSEAEYSIDNYQHFCLDVCNEKEVKKMFSQIRKNYGRLDILINNAGIASMNHILITPITTVNKILNTNVVGTFLFCREAAKIMKKNQNGRIINFATVATPLKLEGEAIYASSKAAVESLTQVIARELSDFGITVNAIGPTPVKTDLIRSVPKEKMDALISMQAIKRYGEFVDISNVIDFYIKPESNFITGQIIFLGGI